MMSVTKSRAAWVRGVKFSTHVVHTMKKTIKMPTVVLPVTLILQATLPNTQSRTVATVNMQQKGMQHLLFCSTICWRTYILQVITIILHRLTVLKICSLLNEFYPLTARLACVIGTVIQNVPSKWAISGQQLNSPFPMILPDWTTGVMQADMFKTRFKLFLKT